MRRALIFGLFFLWASGCVVASGFHLVIRLQDDPNGSVWRNKLCAQAQAPVDPQMSYPLVPLDEIAQVLRLSDGSLDLDYFQKTYGGTVQGVYQSNVLLKSFGAAYLQLKRYLKYQDPKATSLLVPMGKYLAYPPELSLFTALRSVEFFPYLRSQVSDPQPMPLPFFLLFSTHPILKKLTSLKFVYPIAPEFSVGWAKGFTNLSQLEIQAPLVESVYPEVLTLTQLETLVMTEAVMTVPAGFSNLRLLTRLNLSSGGITMLPPSLGQLTALTDLDLSANGNWDTPMEPMTGILSTLTNLLRLNLSASYQKSGSFPFQCKPGFLPKLTYLNLSENYVLRNIPADLGYLTRLQELDLSHVLVESFPDSLKNLPSLTTLRIDFNNGDVWYQIYQMVQLTSLYMNTQPDDLYDLQRLTNLKVLAMNLDDPFNDNFRYRLTQLEALSISSPNENPFPSFAGNCFGLKTLDLSDYNANSSNLLIMSYFSQLETLLCRNYLPMNPVVSGLYPWTTIRVLKMYRPVEVPEAIARLVNLEELSLFLGTYTSLPPSIQNLTKLWKLEMSFYGDGGVNQGILEVVYLLGSLRYLSLEDMKAWTITENIQYLPQLEYFNMSLSGLKEISPEIGVLTKLQTLLISDLHGAESRDITALPSTITNLTNLVYLDVSGTSVSQLPPQIFQQGTTVYGLKGAQTQ